MKHLPFFFLAFCVGFSAHAQVPSYVPNDGLIAWYEMDGNFSDSSPHGHDGTATNLALATDRFGVDGGCLSFSGSVVPNTNRTQIANDAYGELPISDTFEDGMTISIWALESSTSDSEFLQRRNNNSIDFTLGRNDDGGVATHMGFEAFAGPGEAGVDSWHHYALTYDEETIKLYIDGVLSNSKSASQNVNGYANWVGLGKYTYYGGLTHFFFFNGLMDELGFWNRSLSPEEIEALFQSQENPSISGCMDETACNYIPQGLTATQYTDSLGYSIASLISSGFDSTNLIGMEYGGGLIYNIEEQGADLVISIVHPPEYADAPVPNMGLDPGSACGAGGQFGGSFLNAPEQCENLVLAGFDDWFLPTIDQVEQVYETLFYSAEFPVNVCATGASGFFKGIDYLSATETCRCYFGTGGILCDAPATNAYEYFPVRQETMPLLTNQSECEYGCNYCGPGTTWDAEMQMCLPEIECDSLYNPDVDFDGFIGLTDLMAILSHYNNEWPPWECGDPLEYQGYDYETVQIGEQCWFAENLKVENYRNGDAIMQVNEASTWQSMSEGGRRIYGLGDMNCGVEGDTIGLCSQSSAEVLNFGGYLYNWYVVAEGSNVCPNGWHAPDNDAFDELLEHAENLSAGLSGLKSTEGWVEGSEGSNQTGFRAIGSGYGGNLGNFSSDGHFTGFWSTNSSSGTNAHHLQIDERPNLTTTGGVFINDNNKKYALSIRCIKDTEQ